MRKIIYFLMVCLTGFLFSCSDDEHSKLNDHQHLNVKKSKVSFNEMKNFLNKHTNGSLPISLNHSPSRGGNNYITEIDSTDITQIINGNSTTFTLFAKTVDDELYYYSNLVIKVINGVTEEYVLHYNPTPEWQAAFDSGERYDYEGELIITDINGNTINLSDEDGTEQRVGGSGNCMIIVFVECYGPPDVCPCDGNGQTFYVTVACPSGGGGGNGNGNGNGNDPTPGGFDTDPNPGGGGGGGSGNSDPEKTPCQTGKALKTNTSFRNKMTTLKNSAQNDNFEKGFLMKPNSTGANGGYDYTEVNGPVNGDGIDLNLQYGDQYAGFIHSHYDRDDMLSVFTVDDLAAIWKFFDRINMTQPEKNFFMGLVTADNTTYLLTIEDLGKFISFGENHLSTTDQLQNLQYFYDTFGINPSAPIEHQRNMFAKILKTFNAGMKLMQGNYINFYGWDTVNVDNNNNVTTNYCP